MSSSVPSNVHVSNHPCLRAKLSLLRSQSTKAREAKQLVHEIATIIGCEALAHGLKTSEKGTVRTSREIDQPFSNQPLLKTNQGASPLGYEYTTETISPASVCLVPILRSGLSMVDALQSLLPEPVPIHHLGMYREKTTLNPVEYYNNLPYHKAGDESKVPELAIVVDPIIATGSTICAAIETLRDWGVSRIITISVLASEGGLQKAAEFWPEGVELWAGGVDAGTDENGMIKPGLGDIGDRLFLTVGK